MKSRKGYKKSFEISSELSRIYELKKPLKVLFDLEMSREEGEQKVEE